MKITTTIITVRAFFILAFDSMSAILDSFQYSPQGIGGTLADIVFICFVISLESDCTNTHVRHQHYIT